MPIPDIQTGTGHRRPRGRRRPRRVRQPAFGRPLGKGLPVKRLQQRQRKVRRQVARRVLSQPGAPRKPIRPRLKHPTKRQTREVARARDRYRARAIDYTVEGRSGVPAPGAYAEVERRLATRDKTVRRYEKARAQLMAARRVQYARSQGYPTLATYNRGNRAIPGRASGIRSAGGDLKVAGLNIDRISGKGGRAALDILEETTRPVHATAAGLRQQVRLVKGGKSPFSTSVPKAFLDGLRNRRKDTFSDVLKEAGVSRALQGAGASKAAADAAVGGAGFALDVAADPITYVGFGSTIPAKVAAKAAGQAAAKRAAEKGLSKKAVQQARSRAARQAWREGSKKPKVTVGAVGGRKVATPIPAPRLSPRVRDKLSKSLPVRPSNISEGEWARLQAADRRRRGKVLSETRRSARRAIAVRKGLGGAQRRLLPERAATGSLRLRPRGRTAPLDASRRVRDAIEAADLSTLAPAERAVAKEIVRENRRLIRMRRAAGERPKIYKPREAGESKGYVFRQSARAIDDPALRRKIGRVEGWAERKAAAPVGRPATGRKTSTMEDFTRSDRRPMREIREESPAKFVEDLPTTMVAKAQKDIGRAANTVYRGEVRALGRRVKKSPGKAAKVGVRGDEAVYRVDKDRLTEVPKKDVPKLANAKPSDLVVLKRAVAEHANEQMAIRKRIPFLDPVTNKVKWALTIPNPQYWSRNYYGGMFNAWEEGASAAGLAKALPAAHRVARRQGKIAKAEETLGGVPKKPAGKIDLGKAGTKDVDEFIDELEQVNVSGGGITSELLGAETRRRSKMQVFEDAPRLAAYIHWRRKGLTPDKATDRAMNSQFDYGLLTGVETNVARRIFPFYTWRSRNVVLQAKTLAQRPGRLATVQKAREELGKGFPESWETDLTESEALGVPFPIPGTKQLAFPALPVTDLNFATGDIGALAQQVMGSVNPVVKAPTEFFTGYSFFFRDQVEEPGRKWYSAPDALIDGLPAPMRKRLIADGVVRKGKDRWTGEMTWQWRGKADYLAKLTPITSTALQAATSGRSRKGQKSGQRVAAWLTGVRTQPFDPEMNELFKLYEKRAKVQDKLDDLIELRVHKRGGEDTPEYARLKERMKGLQAATYKQEGKVGKKDRGPSRGTGGRSSGTGKPWIDSYGGGGGAKGKAKRWIDQY